MQLKKWQEWVIVAVVGVLVAVGAGAGYYLYTNNNTTTKETPTKAANPEVMAIEKDINSANSIDLSDLDSIVAELNSIDLTGI